MLYYNHRETKGENKMENFDKRMLKKEGEELQQYLYEIIFCCNSCHKLIHLWQLNIDESKIIKLCENDGERQLIKCNICWTSIRNIWGAKYCDKCRVIANRLAQKRFNEKKKLLKLL